jgi:endoglucanase
LAKPTDAKPSYALHGEQCVTLRALAGLFSSAVMLWLTPVHAASCLSDKSLGGVNLAGAEFNSKKIPGVVGRDYVYPNDNDLTYFRSIGAESIRLPVRWERLQPQLLGGLNDRELALIEAVTATATKLDLCLIIDIHNYGGYAGNAIGSEAVPIESFLDLWRRIADRFRDNANVAFGLMNEPSALSIAQWKAIAQRSVDEIRKAGAGNLVLVSGGRWSGAHEWGKRFGETSNADAFASIRDPVNRTLIEVHQYADFDYSGTHSDACVSPGKIKEIMDGVARWSKSSGQRLFLGEFGVPPTDECLQVLDAMLVHMKNNAQVWRGWTYWAAGAWWGKYPLSIQPRNGEDAPQTATLRKFLAK